MDSRKSTRPNATAGVVREGSGVRATGEGVRSDFVMGWDHAKQVTRRAITREDLERMGMPEVLWRTKVTGVPASVQQVISNYLFKIDEYVSRGAGLFLTGPSGVGKSGIASLIAKEARARGKTVFFTPVFQLRDAMKAKVLFDEEQSYMQRCRAVDVLVLDNLQPDDLAGFDARSIEELVTYRKARQKTTVVTSRATISEIRPKSERFLEATLGAMVYLPVSGPDLNLESHTALSKEVLGVK